MTNNAIKQVAEHLPESPIPPMVGIAAIALQQAMQYHDIGVIKDGAMYQQLKLEGKNIESLHLDMVFDTAKRIEQHLMLANERIATYATNAVLDAVNYGINMEKEFENMIRDFMDEEDPLHPENHVLKQKFKEAGFQEGYRGCEDKNLLTFTRACGIEDVELSTFKSALDTYFGEDKSKLIDKILIELSKPDAA